MKKLMTALISTSLLLGVAPVFAKSQHQHGHAGKTRIAMRLQAQQWVNATSARVTVNVNATINDSQMGKVHQELLTKLSKISTNTKWHITSFNRSRNQSGLEQLQATAQARLADNKLADLRQSTTSISKPGMTFKIQSVEFTPSFAEIQQVRSKLRESIYQQAQQEVANLNKVYPGENFHIRVVRFVPRYFFRPMQRNAGVRPNVMMMRRPAVPAGNGGFSVSNKQVMSAYVVLTSKAHKGKEKLKDNKENKS